MNSTPTGPGEPGTSGANGAAARPAVATADASVPAPDESVSTANEAIREFVAGRTVWSKEALAELDRLRGRWQRAVRAEMVKAA